MFAVHEVFFARAKALYKGSDALIKYCHSGRWRAKLINSLTTHCMCQTRARWSIRFCDVEPIMMAIICDDSLSSWRVAGAILQCCAAPSANGKGCCTGRLMCLVYLNWIEKNVGRGASKIGKGKKRRACHFSGEGVDMWSNVTDVGEGWLG